MLSLLRLIVLGRFSEDVLCLEAFRKFGREFLNFVVYRR